MLKILIISGILLSTILNGQDIVQIGNGATITIPSGTRMSVGGGITIRTGGALVNNDTLTLTNNPVFNQANWTDSTALGALSGTGVVVFNSTNPQIVNGKSTFYNVEVNTNGLTLGNNNLVVSNSIKFTAGKVFTSTYALEVTNNTSTNVIAGTGNTNFTTSYVVGNLKRRILSGTSSIYNFPVGDVTNSHLLSLRGSAMIGTNNITCYYAAKQGTDAGLNVSENGIPYTSVNSNGVWYLIGDTPLTSGSYLVKVFINSFTGLADNRFAILHRPLASNVAADWKVPVGSSIGAINTSGRTVASGFAYRTAINSSSPTNTYGQFGIGQSASNLRIGNELSLTGKHEDRVNKLAWQTTNKEVDYYEVQKLNADSIFQTIGTVSANDVDSLKQYGFSDFKATMGENQYQLKMMNNKKAEYSEIVNIFAVEGIDQISYFPNPVQQVLHLNINASESNPLILKIVDSKGIEVHQSTFQTFKGKNKFELDVAHLLNGIYYIQYSNNSNKNQSINFLKVN